MSRPLGGRTPIGIAIGAESLWVLPSAGTRPRGAPWHSAIEYEAEAGWAGLVAALEQARSELRVVSGSVHIAVLPPVVQVRCVQLPRMTAAELAHVVTRDADRYFLAEPGPRLVGASVQLSRRKAPALVFCAMAPEFAVEQLHAAMPDGWTIESVLPAHHAWAAGGLTGVCFPGHEERMELSGGKILGVRRVRQAGLDSPGDDPAEAAVRFAVAAGNAGGAELISAPVARARRAWGRRLSRRLASAAALFMLLAAGVEWWGIGRELQAARESRAAIASSVAEAMRLREGLTGLESRLGVLAEAEHRAPRWSRLIAQVAIHLPADAHLLGLRGHGDTLVLEGQAARAAGVFSGLRDAPIIGALRAEAPIRREARDGDNAIELFTLSGLLSNDSAGSAAVRR